MLSYISTWPTAVAVLFANFRLSGSCMHLPCSVSANHTQFPQSVYAVSLPVLHIAHAAGAQWQTGQQQLAVVATTCKQAAIGALHLPLHSKVLVAAGTDPQRCRDCDGNCEDEEAREHSHSNATLHLRSGCGQHQQPLRCAHLLPKHPLAILPSPIRKRRIRAPHVVLHCLAMAVYVAAFISASACLTSFTDPCSASIRSSINQV